MMKKGMWIAAVCFTVLVTHAMAQMPNKTPAEQCAYNGVDYTRAVSIAKALPRLLAKNNKDAVAKLMRYPVRVNEPGKKSELIHNKKELLANWDQIFSKAMIKKITKAKVEPLFCNDQGAMMASGSVWFQASLEQVGIFAINVSD